MEQMQVRHALDIKTQEVAREGLSRRIEALDRTVGELTHANRDLSE